MQGRIETSMAIPGDGSYGEVRVFFENLNQAYAFKRLVCAILQEAPALAGCEENTREEDNRKERRHGA